HTYPPAVRRTVRVPYRLTERDFAVHVRVKGSPDEVTARVIDLGADIANKELHVQFPVAGGELKMDPDKDILKVAAIDRTHNSAKMFVGFVRGFGLKRGAFAVTAAWDVANIVVVGASEKDMAGAVNRIRELQGGAVVYADDRVLAELPMPIAGQTSELKMETIAERLETIQKELERLGCKLSYAHLMLNTLTTTIVPAIRISTDGLLGIKEGKVLPLIVK
ncbi:MAG: adenine deaminase, partial [Chloroflexi bacterium]|nr:adenine deaminase [Chloroflexota bacterium]